MTSSALDIARAYVTRSPPWNPVPVPYKKKGPTARKWQDRVITAENVEQFFNAKPMNIGIVLGPTSHGLVDLDLDCPEAIAIAPALLPPTKAIFGRASARGSHRLYYHPTLAAIVGKATEQLTDPITDDMLLEVRLGGATGAQSVFPGSTHESGEVITWEENGEPSLAGDDLVRRAKITAALCLLARYWPKKEPGKHGSRHKAALTVGGFLARCGFNLPTVKLYVEFIARAAMDEEVRDRIKAAEDTTLAYEKGEKTRGYPALKEAFGDKIAEKVAEWIGGYDGGAQDALAEPEPVIDELPPLTLEAWATRDLPPPDFLLGHWLTTTSRVLLSASTGIGKTNAAIALGMRVSHGVGFLHWQQRRPARVLYVDGEMSRRLLKERLACEEGRLGSRPPGFLALSREDLENFQPLNTPKGQAWLLALIKKIGKLDLIIFDNVMSLLIGSMIEEESWAQAMPLVRILTQRNIGQLWVHHTGHDETRAYGTKTREWQLDTVIHLEAVNRDDADLSFKLTFPKARERTPATRLDFQDVNISLINDEWQHELTEYVDTRPASPTAMKFLDALVNVLGGDQTVLVVGHRKAARREDWLRECAHLGLVDMARANSARAQLSTYRRQLVVARRVACSGELTWLL